jgi:hypothetical protein
MVPAKHSSMQKLELVQLICVLDDGSDMVGANRQLDFPFDRIITKILTKKANPHI